MADREIEHHAEVRRGRPWAAALLAVLALAAIGALLLVGGRDGGSAEGPRPAVTPSTGTSVPDAPLVHAVADTAGGPAPASTSRPPVAHPGDAGFEALQATPIVTDGLVVVLADGGTLLAGAPGQAFRSVLPRTPVSALAGSEQPGQVWAVTAPREATLIDVRDGSPVASLALGGDRVLGPAGAGLVTVAGDGALTWRRPGFDPAPVPLLPGRTLVDAAGGVVLVERPPDGATGARVFEIFAADGGELVGGARTPPGTSGGPAVLAPDGRTVALPEPDGWIVRDVRSLREVGRLPAVPGDPVWIGADRWAVLVDGRIAASDGTERTMPWRVRALAEMSP